MDKFYIYLKNKIKKLKKNILKIWKFMVHVFLKPGLKNFEHYFTGSEMSSVVW